MTNNASVIKNVRAAMDAHRAYLVANKETESTSATDRWRHQAEIKRLWSAIEDAGRTAARAFADLNGWRWSDSFTGFKVAHVRQPKKGATTFDRLGVDYSYWEGNRYGDEFDHALHFRRREKPCSPVALVGQPYGHLTPDRLPVLYGKLDSKDEVQLVWHAPPVPKASIYYPGSAYFYVLTRPETKVQWLPEQCEIIHATAGEAAT